MLQWIWNIELISIVLGVAAMALPVAGMARRARPAPWAAGGFFLALLSVGFQLYILSRHALLEHTSTLLDTTHARFLAAMVLLVCTAALNLAAFLLARRRAHK